MPIYWAMRWSGWLTLIAYITLRWNSQPTLWSELFAYNLVPLLCAISVAICPIPVDKYARFGIIVTFLLWTSGSIAAAVDSFFNTNFELYSQFAYIFFYPVAIFGVIGTLSRSKKGRWAEILTVLIIAMSATAFLSLFIFRKVSSLLDGSQLDIFLTIIYLVGDLLLFFIVSIYLAMNHFSKCNFLIVLGIVFYSASDAMFLWRTLTDTYIYGELSDSLWLIGFLLIAEASWHVQDEATELKNLPPISNAVTQLVRKIIRSRGDRYLSDEQLLARTDELTGLANRRRFLAEFESFKEGVGSLLILDLDGFKPVNDSLGHAAGDELLKQVARRLERVIPRGSLLARLGGDEFGALIPGRDGHEVAYALRASLAYPFTIAGRSIRLDVSIGEAVNEPAEANSDSLLRRADEAMYRAKKLRTGVLRWEPTIMSSRD